MAELVQPRTLLEAIVRQRQLSWDEAADLVVSTAQQHEKASISMSGRHLGRLARNERPGNRPNPATCRALQYAFDRHVDELLASYISTDDLAVTIISESERDAESSEPERERTESVAMSSYCREYLPPHTTPRWTERADDWMGEADPDNHEEETGEDFMTDQKRRQLLLALAAQGGAAVAVPLLLDALRAIRVRADLLLETQSVSLPTVEKWETIAHNYGHLHLGTPPHKFLTQALYDFSELQNILSRRQSLEVQKRLHRVMAQLAGLIGITVNDISPESQSWFHTAQLAADEIGDRALRAWATAYESMSYLWWGRPVEHVIELSQKAQSIAGSTPNVGGAVATAMEARAQARLGRRHEAISAIHRAETIFEHLSPADSATNVLGFYEHLLRFCQETALTSLGDTAAALAAQQRTLEISSGADVVDSALVELDRATCLIRDGELLEGCHIAGQTLLNLPSETRRGVPLIRAREVMGIISPRDSRLEAVRNFYEIIRSSSAA